MMTLSPEKKIAGILAPVSALRGGDDLGVGDAAAAIELVRWAGAHGFGLVQVLPLNETGSDHSPYNIISSMAIEPSTIATTPAWIPELSPTDFEAISARHGVGALREGPVRHAAVKALKRELLEAAFKKLSSRGGDRKRLQEFAAFESESVEWLEPYGLFRALIAWNDNSEIVTSWPQEHRTPESARDWAELLSAAQRRRFRGLVRFFCYVQWIAHTQWKTVRDAGEAAGVALMGDIPVGVSIYSADVWERPEIFDLTRSSGAPPEKVFKSDPFTEKWGQNWGFPLYNWQAMSHDNFAWWRRRLTAARDIFHFLRVDHALGFFRIYSFPWRPEENARFTALTPGEAREITGGRLPGFVERDDSSEHNRDLNRYQGEMLLRIFLEETGEHRLVAEDLGEVAPYVRPTLAALEVPGFKIPQWERLYDNGPMVPGTDYQRLSLATFATHDHPPIRQFWNDWLEASSQVESRDNALKGMRELLDFCGRPDIDVPCEFSPEIHAVLLRGLFACNSWLAVHQITDLFGLADRFNVPGAVGDANWTARIDGKIGDWDSLYASAITSAVKAVQASGRSI